MTGAVFDADHDGRLDLVTAEWEPSLPTRFWRNTGAVGHWLSVVAPPETTVEVSASGGSGDGERLASGTVGVATGYSAGPPDRVEFGLGATRTVDVTITRPGARPSTSPCARRPPVRVPG